MPQDEDLTNEQSMAKARELSKLPDASRVAGLKSLPIHQALHVLTAALCIGLNQNSLAEAEPSERP